jgi:hypothetical protein
MKKQKRNSTARKKKVILTPEMVRERARVAWNKKSEKMPAAGIRDHRKEQAKWRRVTRDLLRARGLVDKHGKNIPQEPVLLSKRALDTTVRFRPPEPKLWLRRWKCPN